MLTLQLYVPGAAIVRVCYNMKDGVLGNNKRELAEAHEIFTPA